jgi:predicted transcriptional regulator of viral defense system
VRVLGGRASYRQVVAHTSRAALRRDLETGAVLRVRRGVYAVPELPPADAVAAQTGGVVSHLSAARVLGLELPFPDDRVHVTVGPSSRVPRRSSVAVHWNRLAAGEVEGSTTTALRDRSGLRAADVLSPRARRG